MGPVGVCASLVAKKSDHAVIHTCLSSLNRYILEFLFKFHVAFFTKFRNLRVDVFCINVLFPSSKVFMAERRKESEKREKRKEGRDCLGTPFLPKLA